MGDGLGAVAAWEQVIRTHPEYARAHFSLGVLAADSQRYDVAVPNFEAALKNEPGFVQARVQLGWVLARSGRPGESLAHFDQALALEPTHSEALSGYGMALIRLGRYKDARDRLSSAAKLYPDQLMITHTLARLLSAAPDASARDGRQAKALVDRLIAKESQSLELAETTAMMLAEIGQFAQAVSVQRTVIEGAQRLNLPAVVARLTTNLQHYERREACRVPFTEEELR
jgi:tetratricopeptide (TPR) repeat protein